MEHDSVEDDFVEDGTAKNDPQQQDRSITQPEKGVASPSALASPTKKRCLLRIKVGGTPSLSRAHPFPPLKAAR